MVAELLYNEAEAVKEIPGRPSILKRDIVTRFSTLGFFFIKQSALYSPWIRAGGEGVCLMKKKTRVENLLGDIVPFDVRSYNNNYDPAMYST
jgi:hypothetical protein